VLVSKKTIEMKRIKGSQLKIYGTVSVAGFL